MRASISIRREAAISFLINALLSLAFFAGTFGLSSRLLAWRTPDNLALDFIPQSAAVALMSALVPCLLARRHFPAMPLRPVLLRAAMFAAGGALLGALLAFAIQASAPASIALSAALLMKLTYGGALGSAVTIAALRILLRTAPSRP